MSIVPQGLKEDGTPAAIGQVSWKSLKPEIASVDSNGTVTAIGEGKSIIQASTSSGLMATAPVEVVPAEVALSSSRIVLAPEDAESLRVLVPSQGGRQIHGAVRWASGDPGVVDVDSSGIVTAKTPGQTEMHPDGLRPGAPGAGVGAPPPAVAGRLPKTVGGPLAGSAAGHAKNHGARRGRRFLAHSRGAESSGRWATPLSSAGIRRRVASRPGRRHHDAHRPAPRVSRRRSGTSRLCPESSPSIGPAWGSHPEIVRRWPSACLTTRGSRSEQPARSSGRE